MFEKCKESTQFKNVPMQPMPCELVDRLFHLNKSGVIDNVFFCPSVARK